MTESLQVCLSCGAETPTTDASPRCRRCGGLLEIRHSFSETAAAHRDRLEHRIPTRGGWTGSGVWRYRELVYPDVPVQDIVSHPEGNTPLLDREPVQRWAGVSRLFLKHEGHNPTGSFKDRGMTVGMTQARRIGARGVACASTGNTSASLAAYAAHAGIPGFVFVPAGKVALGKMAQTLAYGARTLAVRGDFDACLKLVEAASEPLGLYLLNSINPFRLEGQKTIVLELLEQLGWDAPDWIALPGGNLGNTSAFGKALREAHQLGLIARVPRLAVIQAAGAAPFAASFQEDFATRHRVQADTVATAIRIGDPASFDRAVNAIRFTNGVVLAVSDEEILDAKAVIDQAGVGCEPASAASVAGVKRLVAQGVIGAEDSVVAVLTGHVLKDPEILLSSKRVRMPIEVDPTIDAIARAIDIAS